MAEVALHLGEDGEVKILSARRGTRVSEAAALHGFDREEVVSRFEDSQGDDLTPAQQRFHDCFLRVLNSTTYLR